MRFISYQQSKSINLFSTAMAEKEIVIEIKNLKKSFGNKHILKGIDLSIPKGESVAVLGRSGSGKSVLIKIISGLLKPDTGTVQVLGQQVDKITPAQLQILRLKIGFSFQNSALYDSMTVRENLEFPLVRNQRNLTKKQVGIAIESALNDVGLSKSINQMPAELSGGQKKRIGIARTLILKPEIMLYDEPTSGLDPLTCVELNNLILRVQKEYKTTSVIITHDLACAKTTSNAVAMLLDGEFILQGSFDKVFSSDDPYPKAFYDYNFTNQINQESKN